MNRRYKAGDAVVFRQGLYYMPWNENAFKESQGADTTLFFKWPDCPNINVQSWSGKNYIPVGTKGLVVGRKNVFLYDKTHVHPNTISTLTQQQIDELLVSETVNKWSKQRVKSYYKNKNNNHIHVVVDGHVIALPYGSRYIEHLDKTLSRCNSATVTFSCQFSTSDMTEAEIESWVKKNKRRLSSACRNVVEVQRSVTKKEKV